MRTGPHPDKVYELIQPAMTIGRDTVNDIVINDPEISRKHARLTLQTGEYLIEDLGSTNGTFVNGQRLVGPHLLRPGELILLGENVSLAFERLQYDPNATIVAPPDLAILPGSADTYSMPAFQPDQPVYPAPIPGEVPAYIPPSLGSMAPDVYYSTEADQARPAQTPMEFPRSEDYLPEPGMQMGEGGDYYQPEQGRKLSLNWILGGVGCLLIFILVCLVVAYGFDRLALYCVPPFDRLFGSWLYPCTP
jgi:hypothetical protein